MTLCCAFLWDVVFCLLRFNSVSRVLECQLHLVLLGVTVLGIRGAVGLAVQGPLAPRTRRFEGCFLGELHAPGFVWAAASFSPFTCRGSPGLLGALLGPRAWRALSRKSASSLHRACPHCHPGEAPQSAVWQTWCWQGVHGSSGGGDPQHGDWGQVTGKGPSAEAQGG